MQQFINATRAAVSQNNWHAALALALTLPDICGRLENPTLGSQARFVAWYDRFMLKRYQARIGADRQVHIFLCSSDCYALRCAFLHQGEFGIDDQRAQQALEHFHFTAPRPGSFVHMNQINGTLQLQVDKFCQDVCEASEEWFASVAGAPEIQVRLSKLARIW
jgi:hypothetical protein